MREKLKAIQHDVAGLVRRTSLVLEEVIELRADRDLLTEIEILQAELAAAKAELATLRTRKTPDYSPAQLANFHESCIAPPKLFIEWHFLPDMPEPRGLGDIDGVWVWAAYQIDGKEVCGDAVYYSERDEWCTVPDSWVDGRDQKIIVRCWVYPPYAAPPKPEGKAEALEFGECELSELEQAALKYFNLEYAESGDGSGDWFVYAPMPDEVKNGYQGSSCECLSDVVEEYRAATCCGCGELIAVGGEEAQPHKCPECGSGRIVPASRCVSIFDLDVQVLAELGIEKPTSWDREIYVEEWIMIHWCADCKHAFDSWIESNMKMAVEKCPKCGGKVAQYCDAVLKAWIVRPEVSNGE